MENYIEKLDSGLRKYRTEIPNLIYELGLTPHELTLYNIIKRTAGDNGGCWKSTRTLAGECNMGIATVSRAKRGLESWGLIQIRHKPHKNGSDYISIVNIWDMNFHHFYIKYHSDDQRSKEEHQRSKEEQKNKHIKNINKKEKKQEKKEKKQEYPSIIKNKSAFDALQRHEETRESGKFYDLHWLEEYLLPHGEAFALALGEEKWRRYKPIGKSEQNSFRKCIKSWVERGLKPQDVKKAIDYHKRNVGTLKDIWSIDYAMRDKPWEDEEGTDVTEPAHNLSW